MTETHRIHSRKHLSFAPLTAVLLLAFAGGAATAAEQPKPDNAALRYWQAFALMPQSKDQEQFINAWETVPLSTLTADLVKDGGYALSCMHGGAALDRCDWGLNYEEGPGLVMPHLARARDLGRFALLRARHRFEDGDPRGGIDDALAAYELGRDAGDPILICILVQYAIQNPAVDALARYLPQLKPAELQYLADRLARTPAGDELKAVWGTESKYMVDWAAERMKQLSKEGGDWGEKMLAMPLWSKEDAARIRAAGVPTLENMLAAIATIKTYLAELEKLTDLPPGPQDARLAELKKQTAQAHPLADILMPNPAKVFETRRRWQARRAMLEAAVAVARDGAEALKRKEHADPFGQGPFEYRKTEGGFELQSKLTYEGKPVALTVGEGAKK